MPRAATPSATARSSGTCSSRAPISRRRSSRRSSPRLRTARRRSSVLSPRLPALVTDLWETMAVDAAAESSLWADCLLPEAERDRSPVFSPLGEAPYALGLETIYEGYLVHYGRPRLFAATDDDTALLLGDYLYAHGVQRIAALDEARA